MNEATKRDKWRRRLRRMNEQQRGKLCKYSEPDMIRAMPTLLCSLGVVTNLLILRLILKLTPGSLNMICLTILFTFACIGLGLPLGEKLFAIGPFFKKWSNALAALVVIAWLVAGHFLPSLKVPIYVVIWYLMEGIAFGFGFAIWYNEMRVARQMMGKYDL